MTRGKTSFDKVPDATTYEEDDEPTPITDVSSSEQVIMKVGLLLERQSAEVKRIPAIEQKLTEISSYQTVLEDRQKTVDDSVASIRDSAEKARSAADKVERSVRSTLWKAFIAALTASVAVIIAVVAAAWTTGGRIENLSQRIITEKVLREEQHRTLKSRLDSLPTKVQVLTKQQMSKFERVVKVDEFKLRCSQLDLRQKNMLAVQVKKGHLPSSFLCR